MKRERQIYNSLMKAVKEGCVPFGYYGPQNLSMGHTGRDAPLWPQRLSNGAFRRDAAKLTATLLKLGRL